MLQFSKYQGLGNDFLLMDGREGQLTERVIKPDPAWVGQICDRRFGIGADGLILALPPRADGDLRMQIFNADGSQAEMCGNGIRCLTRFLADSDGELCGQRWNIETLAGMICPILQEDGQICVDMGSPFLDPESIPTTLIIGSAGLPQGELHLDGTSLKVAAVGMGNPHLIVPVEDLDTIPFENWGQTLEQHQAFPAKTNVHFLQIHGPNQLEIRVWERGSGPTLACGTGACASLVAACLLGLSDDNADVFLPGGVLQISWPGRRGSVFMTGPAEAVFDGVLTPLLTPSHTEALPQDDHQVGSVEDHEYLAKLDGSRIIRDSSLENDKNFELDSLEEVNDCLTSPLTEIVIKPVADSLGHHTRIGLERYGQI